MIYYEINFIQKNNLLETKFLQMPTSKQTTVRAKAKKNIVFEAAHEVFAQYGYKRTTMNDIAQAADISRPALYLIFDNKENLF